MNEEIQETYSFIGINKQSLGNIINNLCSKSQVESRKPIQSITIEEDRYEQNAGMNKMWCNNFAILEKGSG